MGRWAWCADGIDFDNDGTPEIYITCGMLTGPKETDLMSFFWRQVVAKSPGRELAVGGVRERLECHQSAHPRGL